jgi:hypothetical protein
MLVQPAKEVEAAASRHFQVGDQHARERKLLAIRIAALTAQIRHCVRSVITHMHRHLNAIFLKCSPQQKCVIRIVLDYKDNQPAILQLRTSLRRSLKSTRRSVNIRQHLQHLRPELHPCLHIQNLASSGGLIGAAVQHDDFNTIGLFTAAAMLDIINQF